jgi:predicted enzyme involved in methoxymalonyl-ACP biosynthesis
VSELVELLSKPEANLFSLHVSDRFGDHGLTGAAVIMDDDILGLVVSCRVLGMGVEHEFLRHIIAEAKTTLTGTIVETPRNIPARNIYRDNGFAELEPGRWRASSIPGDFNLEPSRESNFPVSH